MTSTLFVQYLDQKPPKIALRVTLGVLLAILARIIYDTILWDPTSHNLAPLEIIIAGIATLPCAFIGAYLGGYIKKNKNATRVSADQMHCRTTNVHVHSYNNLSKPPEHLFWGGDIYKYKGEVVFVKS